MPARRIQCGSGILEEGLYEFRGEPRYIFLDENDCWMQQSYSGKPTQVIGGPDTYLLKKIEDPEEMANNLEKRASFVKSKIETASEQSQPKITHSKVVVGQEGIDPNKKTQTFSRDEVSSIERDEQSELKCMDHREIERKRESGELEVDFGGTIRPTYRKGGGPPNPYMKT